MAVIILPPSLIKIAFQLAYTDYELFNRYIIFCYSKYYGLVSIQFSVCVGVVGRQANTHEPYLRSASGHMFLVCGAIHCH